MKTTKLYLTCVHLLVHVSVLDSQLWLTPDDSLWLLMTPCHKWNTYDCFSILPHPHRSSFLLSLTDSSQVNINFDSFAKTKTASKQWKWNGDTEITFTTYRDRLMTTYNNHKLTSSLLQYISKLDSMFENSHLHNMKLLNQI